MKFKRLIASELLKAQITGTSKAIIDQERLAGITIVFDDGAGAVGELNSFDAETGTLTLGTSATLNAANAKDALQLG